MSIELKEFQSYLLMGLDDAKVVWDNFHPLFGKPNMVAAIYLCSCKGTRIWHIFEVRHEGRDAGVILMNSDDLNKIKIQELKE